MIATSRARIFAVAGVLLLAAPALAAAQNKQAQQAQPAHAAPPPPPPPAPPPQHVSPPPAVHSAPPPAVHYAPPPVVHSAPPPAGSTPDRSAPREVAVPRGVFREPVTHSQTGASTDNRDQASHPRGQTSGQSGDRHAVSRVEGRGRASVGSDGSQERAVSGERARGDRPAFGVAVPRQGPPPGHGGGGGGYYPGYFPWYYYPYTFGFAWDPFWWGGYSTPAYGYPTYGSSSTPDYGYGGLKLKVKPGDAQVYVDGYFAGLVDDYDGLFQKMNLEAGPHHIEIRADGREPLAFDVRIQYDDTVTYRGELRKSSRP